MLVAVMGTFTGTPMVAEGTIAGFGETVAPRMLTVRVNGALTASELRRASTVTSHTPARGLVVVRLVALPVEQVPVPL